METRRTIFFSSTMAFRQLYSFGELTHGAFVCLFLSLEVRSSDVTLLQHGYFYSYSEFDLTYLKYVSGPKYVILHN